MPELQEFRILLTQCINMSMAVRCLIPGICPTSHTSTSFLLLTGRPRVDVVDFDLFLGPWRLLGALALVVFSLPACGSNMDDSEEPPILSQSSLASSSKDQVFEAIIGSSAISTRMPTVNDPRVSLRPSEHKDMDHQSLDTLEPCSLSAFRETEGSAKRLSNLRRLFDTIPIKPPAAPTSPPSSTHPLPELDQEERQCEWDRRIYARELWRKCNSSEATTTTAAASAATNLRSPPEHHDDPSRTGETSLQRHPDPLPIHTEPSSPLPTAAARWNAFERYAEAKEKELWRVFVELDSDGDMRLRRTEVAEACRRAGIQVREATLDDFIRTVDKSGDGAISFEEWRDFLLLLPRPTTLPEIFRYYKTHRLRRPSMSRLNQDGDVAVGGGKTGWNELLGKSAIAAKEKEARASRQQSTSSAAGSTLQDATNLQLTEAEAINPERQWALACRRKEPRLAAQEVGSPAAQVDSRHIFKSSPAAPIPDTTTTATATATPQAPTPIASTSTVPPISATEAEVKVPTPSSLPQPQPPPIVVAPTAEDDDQDLVDDDSTPGMFAGAGKFLLAGGLAGAGE